MLSSIRRLQKRKLIVLYCGNGTICKLAASLLLRNRIYPVILVEGTHLQIFNRSVRPAQTWSYDSLTPKKPRVPPQQVIFCLRVLIIL